LERRLVAGVIAGRPYLEIHVEAHRLIAELLAATGLVKVSAEEAFDRGLTRSFLPHGVGHHLGLQVHDVGGRQTGPDGGVTPPPAQYPFLRNTRTLEPGHFVTIEPGLYFIPLLLDPLRASRRARTSIGLWSSGSRLRRHPDRRQRAVYRRRRATSADPFWRGRGESKIVFSFLLSERSAKRTSNPYRPKEATMRLRRYFSAVSLAVVFLATAAHAKYPQRGYQPRACGFDMNRNGIRGEAETDCNVCDGTTADPDGDLTNEDLIYVNCGTGTDTATCGSPANPCRTIRHAWMVRANGAGEDGIEDIVCFTGVCTTEEAIGPRFVGSIFFPPTYSVPASGSEAIDWLYPKNPTMLVGWDTDNDGRYPPVDTDDIAVLDGSAGLQRAFEIDSGGYLEMAHFTVRNYGRFTTNSQTGFLRFERSIATDFTYIHDLRLEGINQDRAATTGVVTFNFFSGTAPTRWVQFSNILASNNGGWFGRGESSPSAPDAGPVRWQNVTRTLHGCDVAACGSSNASAPGFRLWGAISGIEILDSVWDANLAAWQPNTMGGPTGARFVSAAQCSRNWTIRNNFILDHKLTLEVQGYSEGFCDGAGARPVDNVVFDANEVRNTYEPWIGGDQGVQILEGGAVEGEVVGRVEITNNFFSSTAGWEAAVWVRSGHLTLPTPTSILIANNTMYGDINRYGAIVIGNVAGADYPFVPQNVEIKNNLIGGLDSDDFNVVTTYAPSSWSANNNVFDPVASFKWVSGTQPTLANWRTASGGDAASRTCFPALVHSPSGNFHLSVSDTCAVDHGIALGVGTPIDIDNEVRGEAGAWDVGADERGPLIFVDGFESGGTGAWTTTVP
ncbi:MAG: M24 family metallopeptidase, partial [Thermoanaerobaculia bacterium]|nr:M24 family metallopeptidase [Thermoanaerobaculia bacterium]